MTVTLQTLCWERDWKRTLTTGRLQTLSEYNLFPFDRKTLLINKLGSYSRVSSLARAAIEKGWISDFIIVEEYADAALRFFDLTRDDLGKGYVYSIAELVGIYICNSDFLLFYMADCMPVERCDWIPAAMNMLAIDERIKVANLLWNGNYEGAKQESLMETEAFFIGQGFSDQCYLIRPGDFRKPIYGYQHPASERYPEYGGDTFEKRVDSWMRCHGYLRATYKHASYLHRNLPPPVTQQIRQKIKGFLRGGLANLRGRSF